MIRDGGSDSEYGVDSATDTNVRDDSEASDPDRSPKKTKVDVVSKLLERLENAQEMRRQAECDVEDYIRSSVLSVMDDIKIDVGRRPPKFEVDVLPYSSRDLLFFPGRNINGQSYLLFRLSWHHESASRKDPDGPSHFHFYEKVYGIQPNKAHVRYKGPRHVYFDKFADEFARRVSPDMLSDWCRLGDELPTIGNGKCYICVTDEYHD